MKISTKQITLLPENNNCLGRLCGCNNEYLNILESYFNVQVNHHGFSFKIIGDKTNVTGASKAIKDLYNKAQTQEISLNLLHQCLQSYKENNNNNEVKILFRDKTIYLKTNNQKNYFQQLKNPENSILFALGPAGTGKTFLAVLEAIIALKAGLYKKILLTRPAIEAGENLGYLPGDLSEKILPYLQPLYDALYQILDIQEVKKMQNNRQIEIAPLAFMRGRTLNESFIILDEGQNTTNEQMKMFLTRLGFHSKMVITGDLSQTDLPKKNLSGLAKSKTLLNKIKGISIINLTTEDVMRHPIVKDIIKAYDN